MVDLGDVHDALEAERLSYVLTVNSTALNNVYMHASDVRSEAQSPTVHANKVGDEQREVPLWFMAARSREMMLRCTTGSALPAEYLNWSE